MVAEPGIVERGILEAVGGANEVAGIRESGGKESGLSVLPRIAGLDGREGVTSIRAPLAVLREALDYHFGAGLIGVVALYPVQIRIGSGFDVLQHGDGKGSADARSEETRSEHN